MSDPRVPPHSTEAETTILGSLLLGSVPLESAQDVLVGDEFYSPANARIWRAIVALSEKGQPTNLVTVVQELKRQGALESVGGAAYVASLPDGLPRITSLKGWAEVVREKAVARQLLSLSDKIAEAAREGVPPMEVVERAQASLSKLGARAMSTGFRSPSDLASRAYDDLKRLSESPDGVVGLRTGLADLDDKLGGMRPGWLVIAAARTGEGKSVLGVQIADSIAKAGGVAAVFSVEMDGVEVTGRRLLSEAGVAKQNVRYMTERDWARADQAMMALSSRAVLIDDSSTQTVPRMRAACRSLRQERGRLDVVVVDYLQILKAAKASERRHIELGTISADLKAMAKDLQVPVVALAQLSRQTENATDRRPSLAHLRESGSLEQDADVVILIWHEEPKRDRDGTLLPQESHLIVAKNRHGVTGVVDVQFNRYFARFDPAENFEQHSTLPEAR